MWYQPAGSPTSSTSTVWNPAITVDPGVGDSTLVVSPAVAGDTTDRPASASRTAKSIRIFRQ